MIRPVPGATADAVVDVQVQRTGGESRLKDERVVLFFLAEKRAERTCGEEKMATPGWTEKKRSSAPLRRGSVPQKIYWEGINLNKISKKIVSAVTMGAFALTLIPAAAFASGPVDAAESSYTVVSNTSANQLTVNLNLNGSDGTAVNGYTMVQIIVKDADGNTLGSEDEATVTGAGLSGSTIGNVDTLEGTTGVAPGVGTPSYTFANVPGGDYTVEVNVQNDSGAEFVQVGTTAIAYVGNVPQTTGNRILIDDNTADIDDLTVGDTKTVEFELLDNNGEGAVLGADEQLYVWAQDGNGHIVDVIDVAGTGVVENPAGVYAVTANENGETADVTFTVDGTYKLYAGVGAKTGFSLATVHELRPINVTVAPAAFETAAIAFDEPVVYDRINADGNVSYWTYTINDNVTPNGHKDYTISGTAYALNGNERVPAENETLTITTQNDNLELAKSEVKTDAKGNFEFTFNVTDTGIGYITVGEPNDQVYAVVKVTQNAMAPVDIETIKDGGVMLAGTDDQYIYNKYTTMGEAVQFNIKDAYDRDATGEEVLALLPAADADAPNHGDFVDVTVPEGSDLTEDDVQLAWDGTAYTVEYVGDNPVKDLIPGEYTVSFSLNNGKDATASFTLAEFQSAESLTVDMEASIDPWDNDTANDNAITAVDDQITLGQNVKGVVYLVDAQGLKVKAPATNLSVGINGEAVAANSVVKNNPYYFTTVDNIPANQSVIGTVVTVKAYDDVNKLYVEKELTVVSNYGDETLAFDPVQGPVGENNAVEISVVDADGNLSKVNGTVSAYIASQSNEDATVELKANEAVKNGEGKLYLESDAEGTVDVVVAVKADNGELYGATLTYTFGDEDPYAGSYVVMTIGSDQYLINNEVLDGSVDNLGAPYVDSAWRTMVPVRVLAESFGAEVTFDEEAQTVTIVDGDTTIVMTVGSTEYTINGEAAEAMDTAPVIGSDNRTYVPVRFVAEGLGYEVTPLYNAENGTTASVVFQK